MTSTSERTSSTDPALAAYEQMASFYDVFTALDDYEQWTQLLLQLLRRYATRPTNQVLDVATGTGKVAGAFAQRGFEVTACDLSPAMLREATTKPDLQNVRLLNADMRFLPAIAEFDLVTCIDDAVNYLLSDGDLLATFHSTALQLRDAGIYIFDVNTLYTYRTTFACTSVRDEGSHFFVWSGQANTDVVERTVVQAELNCFSRREKDMWHRSHCLHQQRHHDRGTIQELLSEAGMELIGVHGLRPQGVLDEEASEQAHTKTFYVARRRSKH